VELGGDAELELIPAEGHTQDGMAIWAPFARVLCCGDYLSPVEIPWLQEHGDRDAYVATLRRLQPYVEQADWVVPGHGSPIDAQRALAILREDLAYLEVLPSPDAPLPLARRDRAMRKIHAENLERTS
jgi:glyoxylase-like metal-dependent hydrolase (beta-lactamase superfamily II)